MTRHPYTVKIAAGVTTIFGALVTVGALMNTDVVGIVIGVLFLGVAALLWKGFAIAKWLGTALGALTVAGGLLAGPDLRWKLIVAAAGLVYVALLWTPGARRYFAENAHRRAVTG